MTLEARKLHKAECSATRQHLVKSGRCAKQACNLHLNTGLSPLEVVQKVQALSEKLIVVVGDDLLSIEAQRNATILFMSLLRSTLSSKRALSEFKLKPEAFDWLIGEIETKFNSVSPAVNFNA